MAEEEEKGFVVKDRRKVSLDDLDRPPDRQEPEERGSDRGDARAASEATGEGERKRDEGCHIPLPEVTFATFVLSLSSSALVHLGDIPQPGSERSSADLALAKQVIDTLGLLESKTKGNLDAEEDRLLKTVLYDLRIRYIQRCGGASPGAAGGAS